MNRHLLATALASLVAVGCAYPAREGERLDRELADLTQAHNQTRQMVEQNEARGLRERDHLRGMQESAVARLDSGLSEVRDSLEKGLDELRTTTDALNRVARKTGADLAVELEQTKAQLSELRERLAEADRRNISRDEQLATQRIEINALKDKLSSTENDLTRMTEQAAAEAEAERRKAAEAHNKPVLGKDQLFAKGVEKIKAGAYAEARQMLTEFLQRFSSDTMAPNAQYWLGESYFADSKYSEAIQEFRRVVQGFPKSDKVPDSLLKIALSFLEQGVPADGRLFLDEVIRTHPKSEAAKQATRKMAELDGKGGKGKRKTN